MSNNHAESGRFYLAGINCFERSFLSRQDRKIGQMLNAEVRMLENEIVYFG